MALSSYSGYVYRLIPYKYRDSLLSVAGAMMIGGRYNPPNEFGVLYTCDTQLTANLEVQALFVDRDGRLAGAPRNPDLMLTLTCELRRVIDLRQRTIQEAFGTTGDELVSNIPSRHILNPKGNSQQPRSSARAATSLEGFLPSLHRARPTPTDSALVFFRIA